MHIYYFRSFRWGQKFRNGLAERFWLGSPSGGYRQDVIQGCRYLKVVLGLEDQPASGASAPHHRDISSGYVSVLTAWRQASPGAGGPRESEEESERPLTALRSNMLSFLPYSIHSKRDTKLRPYLRGGRLGSLLSTGTPQNLST